MLKISRCSMSIAATMAQGRCQDMLQPSAFQLQKATQAIKRHPKAIYTVSSSHKKAPKSHIYSLETAGTFCYPWKSHSSHKGFKCLKSLAAAAATMAQGRCQDMLQPSAFQLHRATQAIKKRKQKPHIKLPRGTFATLEKATQAIQAPHA